MTQDKCISMHYWSPVVSVSVMVNWSSIVSELPDSITTPNFTFVNEDAYVNPEPLIVTMSPPAMLPLEGLMFDTAGYPNGLTIVVVVSVASLFSLSLTVNVTTYSPTGKVILGFGPDPTTVLPSFLPGPFDNFYRFHASEKMFRRLWLPLSPNW
jgi:hypothetical protein